MCTPNATNVVWSHCQCVLADGVERGILTANRMLPGPSIQVCENDKVVIDVENHMEGMEVTIHWHGIWQRGSQYYDGVPFVTQCPIQQGNTFRWVAITFESIVASKKTIFLNNYHCNIVGHIDTQSIEFFANDVKSFQYLFSYFQISMARKRWHSLLARPHWSPEIGRSLRQHRCQTASIKRSQQPLVRLWSNDPRDVDQWLVARRCCWKIPWTSRCQHRSRPRISACQRKGTVQRSQHRIHDEHASGSFHDYTRQKIQIQNDKRFCVRVSRPSNVRRPQLDCNRDWRWTSTARASKHHHFILR